MSKKIEHCSSYLPHRKEKESSNQGRPSPMVKFVMQNMKTTIYPLSSSTLRAQVVQGECKLMKETQYLICATQNLCEKICKQTIILCSSSALCYRRYDETEAEFPPKQSWKTKSEHKKDEKRQISNDEELKFLEFEEEEDDEQQHEVIPLRGQISSDDF